MCLLTIFQEDPSSLHLRNLADIQTNEQVDRQKLMNLIPRLQK